MDNLTHSIIGVAFARSLPRRFQRPEIYWAAVIGNNLPDADFLMRFFPGSTPFDYLIHHRGYTHTFILAPVMGTLAAFLAAKWANAKSIDRTLVGIGILSAFMHIGADFMNNYGVHPLSPFSNRWFYGDSIFIVEPLIWFSLLPFIATRAERPWAKTGWSILGAAMVALIWVFPLFSRDAAVALTALFGLSIALTHFVKIARVQTALACALFTGVIGIFFTASHFAKSYARESWSAKVQAETWVASTATPQPGNPFCWSVWTVSQAKDASHFRFANVSLWPSLTSAEECGRFESHERTAELKRLDFGKEEHIRWKFESILTQTDWQHFTQTSPKFRRFLSFARLPFVQRLPDGRVVAGDLRYDREHELGFSEIMLEANEPASDTSGPWEPPYRPSQD